MTKLYFVTLTATYLANAIYFVTKFVAHSTKRAASQKQGGSGVQTRCCS